jgi:hypothetical protein
VTPDEFDNEIAQLEVNLDRLRALYEQYFLGIERIEPTVARKTVDRQFWTLKRVVVRNTARRFRFQTLVQRYNTLQQHWMKVCRQIENGSYVRHVQKAKRRDEERRALTIAARKRLLGVDANVEETGADHSATPIEAVARRQSIEPPPLSDGTPTGRRPSFRVKDRPPASAKRISLVPIDNELARKIRNSAPPMAAPAPKRPAPPLPTRAAKPMQTPVAGQQNKPSPSSPYDGPITEERVGGLYQELQRVRRRLNQTEMDVSLEALARSLRATEARLKAKYEGKRVDFRVEVYNGKAVIKPSVKR